MEVFDDNTHSNHEIVILVHGTYAGAKEDEGTHWWQRGSTFWNNLNSKLPLHIRLPQSIPLFHWTGENNILYRHTAGQDLYEFLNKLEEKKIPYHLVAHSHGGSVLWSALKIADFSVRHSNDPDTKTDRFNKTNTAPLEYLRSCTAVGTPFITYNNSPNSQKWLLLVEFSAMLIEFIVPIIATVILFQFVGWWALFALTSIVFLVPLIEILTLPTKFSAQEASSESLEKQYGKHWLSIWSDDDEAINLLRTAIQARNKQFRFRPSLPIIPRAETSWLTKILFFGETLFLYPFDRLIVPTLTKIARNRICASILGVPVLRGVKDISPWPCSKLNRNSVLSNHTTYTLKRNADEHLSRASPTLRETLKLLGNGIFQNPLRTMQEQSLRELVHTSYFENDDIVCHIADHIMKASLDHD